MTSNLRRRLTGLLALAALLAIVVGLPVVLLALGADPIPRSLPTWARLRQLLTSPDDGTLALTVLKVTAWAVWVFLTGLILLEIGSRLRRVRTPRLAGLSLPQSTARALVSTAALLFFAAPLSAQSALAVPARPPAVAAAATGGQTPTPAQVVQPTPATANPAPAPATSTSATVTHTVKQGETLWSIAAEHLGAGARYREIVALNPDLLPTGGAFIKVGWVLTLPAPTTPKPAGTYTVQRGDTLSEIAQETLGDARRYPEIAAASQAISQSGGAHLTDPDLIDVGWTLHLPSTATSTPATPSTPAPIPPPSPDPATPVAPTPAQPAPAAPSAPPPAATAPSPQPTSATPTGQTAEAPEDQGEELPWPVRTSFGVGAVLAAGIITLLGARRATQHRHRPPGTQLPMPAGATATAEHQLRTTADVLSVEAVDNALRTLARECATNNGSLPLVRAARLTAEQFDLYLAHPSSLPHPWTGTTDGTVWTLHLHSLTDLPDGDVADVPAPYPALVTIGHDDEDGHVFLDLEHLGALDITGEPQPTRDVLTALAVELATSRWADDLQVTIVGGLPELEDALQTGRIRYLPSVGRILDDLAERAAQDRAAMRAAGTADLHHARVNASAADAWAPEILLLAGPVTPRQRNQLQSLLDELPRVAIAVVTTSLNVGEWTLDLTAGEDPSRAVLSPIGLQIRPQRIPAEQYAQILELAALTDVDSLPSRADIAPAEPTITDIAGIDPVDEPTAADVAAPPPAEPFTEPDEPADTKQHPDDSAEQGATLDPALTENTHSVSPADIQAATGPGQPAPAGAETVDAPPGEETSSQPSTDDPTGVVQSMPVPAPRILVLGPVELIGATGPVEPNKKARLTEYAAYLALHPGASHTSIDEAIWPNRKTESNLNTRNTATAKLRKWVGKGPAGQDYLPRHPAAGYAFTPQVRTDVDTWDELLVAGPLNAPSENLEAALKLVRGRPFAGRPTRYYAWTETIAHRLISEIVDASYELGRRRLMEGRYRAAEAAVVIGLSIEPAQERLWRIRILAAHESRNPAATKEAIDRMLTIARELECDLEPETEQLLEALSDPTAQPRAAI